MRIAVTSDYHFRRGPDGVYTDTAYPVDAWSGLLQVFDEVIVLARVGEAPIGPGAQRADGPGVRFIGIPDFIGGRGLAQAVPGMAAAVAAAMRAVDVVILRAPGVIATAAYLAARSWRRPYAIEVLGDPYESLTTAGPAMARLSGVNQWLLRAQIRGAMASRYVTDDTLQRRYPPRAGSFTIAASDVALPDALFAVPPAAITDDDVLHLGFVGPLARPYKGVDVLLAALARTTRPHRLTIVGDGALRATLTADAARLGIAARVDFRGAVPTGDPVFAILRTLDLFVLPSRTEGLPRALIEAMAVGLPVLATPVGGVPELLDATALVPVGDAAQLARAIDAVASDPTRRRAMAAANRARARRFRASQNQELLVTFYRAIAAAIR